MLDASNKKGVLRAGDNADCKKSEQAFSGDLENKCKYTYGWPNYNFLRKIENGKLATESSGYSLTWTSK